MFNMKPVKFKQQNCVCAENQPEYIPLPAYKSKEGIVTTCWKLSFVERIKVLFRGNIWWQTMTFNKPLQPQRPNVQNPLLEEKK